VLCCFFLCLPSPVSCEPQSQVECIFSNSINVYVKTKIEEWVKFSFVFYPKDKVDIIQLLTFNEVYSWLYGPGQWLIDRLNKIGYNCFIIFQDYLNIKILKYDENFEILWNFWKLWKFYENFDLKKKKNWNFLKFLKFWTFFAIWLADWNWNLVSGWTTLKYRIDSR
jgi:hypothetical protein